MSEMNCTDGLGDHWYGKLKESAHNTGCNSAAIVALSMYMPMAVCVLRRGVGTGDLCTALADVHEALRDSL